MQHKHHSKFEKTEEKKETLTIQRLKPKAKKSSFGKKKFKNKKKKKKKKGHEMIAKNQTTSTRVGALLNFIQTTAIERKKTNKKQTKRILPD